MYTPRLPDDPGLSVGCDAANLLYSLHHRCTAGDLDIKRERLVEGLAWLCSIGLESAAKKIERATVWRARQLDWQVDLWQDIRRWQRISRVGRLERAAVN